MAINSPYRTSADLVLDVLKNLRVYSVGNPVDPEDFAFVNEKLDPTIRKLAMLEVVFVADANNIPGAWFSDLSDILAGECASRFGFSGQDFNDMVNKGLGGAAGVEIGAGTAAKSLKIGGRGRPTYEVQRIQNY
ncbi:MAG: hypothetical protein PS018_20300 [bacterium]|nr:hypothetical protein [bacterium]